MYILLAIIAFGVLIFIHELGHFLAAKACGVTVTEFAIGMGPQLLKWERGETVYSLRALPVGGFCAMEGESEASDDPHAFTNQKIWKRLVILAAGSFMNFLLGFALVVALYAGAAGFTSPVIEGFFPDCPYEGTLQTGDEIYRVNGKRVWFTGNFSELAAADEDGDLDLVIRRGGKRVTLKDYHLVPVEYPREDGTTELKYGLYFTIDEATPGRVLRYSLYTSFDYVRMVKDGLVSLLHGDASMKDMTGVVGMVDLMNEAGQSAETTSEGIENVLYLAGFIAVNLAVMNMLPIPALDGGHILTLLLTFVIESVTRKKLDPRIEGMIHYVGLLLLLGLMLLIMCQDVVRIIIR